MGDRAVDLDAGASAEGGLGDGAEVDISAQIGEARLGEGADAEVALDPS